MLPLARKAASLASHFDGELDQAVAAQSVTLTLEDEIDVSRGDVITTPSSPPGVADHFRRMSSGCTKIRCYPAGRTS